MQFTNASTKTSNLNTSQPPHLYSCRLDTGCLAVKTCLRLQSDSVNSVNAAWPSSRNQSLSTAGLLRCMPYFTKCTESLDGKTPVTFLLSQNLEIYFRWQILTRVVNFCPYQICSCPCDTKLKLIPQYSWVQAASRFYNHVPRTLLNRGYSPTFPRTTGRHF